MKYLYKIVLFSLIIIGFNSCDENENFEIQPPQGGIAINSPIDGSSIALIDTNEDNPGLTVSWTATTIEGTGVTYTVEVALIGTDFEVPFVIGTTEATSIHLTVEELNTLALDVLEIEAETEEGIDIRVYTGSEVSPKISVLLTPYKVEFTEFYVVGNITDPEWSPADALPMTNIGFNEFEITVDLADGAEFKFLPTNTSFDGDWGNDPDNIGNLIEDGEVNLSGYPAGKYDISVNLNTFTFTVEEVKIPENLFLVGDHNGWDNTTAPQFYNNGAGVFSIVQTFEAGNNFKFLEALGTWDGDWGESKITPGILEQDDEDNLTIETTGLYVIILDYNTLTIKVASIDNMYMVGDHNGWDNSTAPQLSTTGNGTFSIVQNFDAGNGFKFLPTIGSWDGDWGESKTIPGMLVQDDEDNLTVENSGTYIVAVDFNTLSFTVSAVSALPTNLFLVGDHNGWDNSSANALTNEGSGVFSITLNLTGGNGFKFLPTLGSWDGDFGASKIISGILEQNDEQNLSVDADGSYKITADFNNGNFIVVLQ